MQSRAGGAVLSLAQAGKCLQGCGRAASLNKVNSGQGCSLTASPAHNLTKLIAAGTATALSPTCDFGTEGAIEILCLCGYSWIISVTSGGISLS